MAKSKQAVKSSYPAKPASKKPGQANKQVTKKRGGLLSFLLVVILVHGILAAFLAYTNLKDIYIESRPWILAGLTLAAVADIVAAVGMWYWKKWGITLYLVASIVQATIHLLLTGSLSIAIFDFVPVAILGYVINLQNKRKLFE